MNGGGGANPSAATLQQNFPGINFVRLAIYNYDSPQSLAAYVNDLTSHGIVVELEDHNNGAGNAGGSQGSVFTGQQLSNELNWYSQCASYFANNPMVWFGTNNEPSENPSASALSDWQKQTYDAIRNAGNTAPVMLEANAWTNNGQAVVNQGYNAADYSGMHNVIWDEHFYGWLTNYSTDPTTNTNMVQSMINGSHAITSADGTMPVIFGEYGNSTTGASIDPNGNQVIQAVQASGAGTVAWAWGTGGPGDGLTTSNSGGLSSFGQMVAQHIAQVAQSHPAQAGASTAAATPATATATTTTATPVQNQVITASAGGAITDAAGNKWTISGGTVQENGQAAGYSANVTELADVGGVISQQNAAGAWYTWSNGTWTGPDASAPVPAASANDSVLAAGATGSLVDANANTWTIQNGTVQENGTAAGYSANVTELAYVNGSIYQENSAGSFYQWTGSTWGAATSNPLPAATATAPAPTATATTTPTATPTQPTASPNDTVLAAGATGAITDAAGNSWTISNGVVDENGKAAGFSANVTELAYVNGTVYQENAAGNWYGWTGTAWGTGSATSPLPAATAPTVPTDTIAVTTGGQTTAVTASGTVGGDTFSLLSNGTTNAVLGSTAGSVAFTGNAGANVTGGSALSVVSATAGNNTFTAGSGAMIVSGGTGADAYTFGSNATYLAVNDFNAAKGDTLSVAASLQGGMQHFADGSGGTVLAFGNGSMIDLHGVAQVPAIHFS